MRRRTSALSHGLPVWANRRVLLTEEREEWSTDSDLELEMAR